MKKLGQMKPIIYAMVGTIGSGKTTYARKLSEEKRALLFCIDENIKQLGQSITSKEDYEKYYFGVRTIIADHASKALNLGNSVVLDFGGSVGHWEWLQSVASPSNAEIEIVHLLAPLQVRRERVRKRNSEPHAVFRFTDAEFDAMPTESAAPKDKPGLRVTEVQTT